MLERTTFVESVTVTPNEELIVRLIKNDKARIQLAGDVKIDLSIVINRARETVRNLPPQIARLFLLAPDIESNAREIAIVIGMIGRGDIQIIPNRLENPTIWQVCSPGTFNLETGAVQKNKVEMPPILVSLGMIAAWTRVGIFEGHWNVEVYDRDLNPNDTTYRRNDTGILEGQNH